MFSKSKKYNPIQEKLPVRTKNFINDFLLDKKSAIPDMIGTRIAKKKKTNDVINCMRAVFLKLNPINSI